jgi:hypothetical protein
MRDVRGKYLLLLTYNNYGTTIIILYRPLSWSVSGGGNKEKTVAGASCVAVPPPSLTSQPHCWQHRHRMVRGGRSRADRREDRVQHRSTGPRPVAAAICGCVVGGTGCSCRCVYVRVQSSSSATRIFVIII